MLWSAIGLASMIMVPGALAAVALTGIARQTPRRPARRVRSSGETGVPRVM